MSNRRDHVMIIYAGKTELADVSLKSMCTLVVEVAHFNFRTNIINCIIGRLSRGGWDGVSLSSPALQRQSNVHPVSGVRVLP